jgi:UDP-glucose 4-epimerase
VRAIVTGGAGFVGSHVVDALVARGDEVLVVDDLSSGRREQLNEHVRLAVADVRDRNAVDAVFDEVRPEACFHLAAQANVRVSVERPAHDADVNVIGTIRVLNAATRHGTRVVFASTGGAIYGECDGPATEDAPRRPLAPYGTSKLAGEEYLAVYNRLHGGAHTSLRYGNVYGPRQDPHGEAGVVAIFFGRLARGEQPEVFGDGTQTRDYIYVADVVEATLAATSRPAGVFNVGTGVETSVLELLDACTRAAGVAAEPSFAPPRAGELQRSALDPTLAERELEFRARTPLDRGLNATWEFVRQAEGVERAEAN